MTRLRKRLQIKFEGKSGSGGGFTENVSATGLLVHSNLVCTPGTSLRGTLQLPDGLAMQFSAQVIWMRRTDGALAHLVKNSMGLRFLEAPDARFYQLLVKPATP